GPPRLAASVPDMLPHQRQAEQMNLAEELLESFVFGNPCLDLRKQILGDVDGARPVPMSLAGDLLAVMQGAAMMTAAHGTAAAAGVTVQRGGQHRRRGAKLLQPAVEHTPNLSRMVRNAHGQTCVRGMINQCE